MSKAPGRVCIALAKKLQKQFPSIEVRSSNAFDDKPPTIVRLAWSPEHLYPAIGAYRTDVRQDCPRWSGCGHSIRADGTTTPVWTIYGWTKMSDLIGPGTLTIHADGEVTNERSAPVKDA